METFKQFARLDFESSGQLDHRVEASHSLPALQLSDLSAMELGQRTQLFLGDPSPVSATAQVLGEALGEFGLRRRVLSPHVGRSVEPGGGPEWISVAMTPPPPLR
jgi:hypothetical protein